MAVHWSIDPSANWIDELRLRPAGYHFKASVPTLAFAQEYIQWLLVIQYYVLVKELRYMQ
jgi:hypothetical protein